MLKLNYTLKAVTPLFTGSNESSGTVKTLRREKVLLTNPIKYSTNFPSYYDKIEAVMGVLYPVYCEIDKGLKISHYGFYTAYANITKAATHTHSKEAYLTDLLNRCGISTLTFERGSLIRASLSKFSDIEFLETIKEDHAYLMILLREYVEYYKNVNLVSKDGIGGESLSEYLYPVSTNKELSGVYAKNFESIPYFGGNSIRGYLRRLMMQDFEEIVGITALEKSVYHQLHTGGNITDSTGFEDISKRETFISNCPPIALFGSAIGNMTIQGELIVLGARLRCTENNSGNASFWEYLQIVFGTRLDSSKLDKAIDIVDEGTKRSPDQMMYEYETFCKGSQFDSTLILKTSKSRKDYDLILSTFYRMLTLWKENPILGGNSARDAGIIELDFNIPKGSDKLYLKYLEDNKDTIKNYFNVVAD